MKLQRSPIMFCVNWRKERVMLRQILMLKSSLILEDFMVR